MVLKKILKEKFKSNLGVKLTWRAGMKENTKLINVVNELVRRAYFCIFATNEERVLSQGGLITACKTYIKSAIVAIEQIEKVDDEDRETLKQTVQYLEKLYSKAVYKSNKFDATNYAIRKKLDKVRYTAKWALSKLEEKGVIVKSNID